jgi:guanylate kinase
MTSLILCISGPEGVGKDTLIRELLKLFPDLRLGKKATTRPPRPDDFDEAGVSKYTHLSIADFMRQRAAGTIVEHSVTATGGYYGSYVDRNAPGIEIRDLDVNGALQLYAKSQLVEGFPRVLLIGILPPCTTSYGLGRIDQAQRLAAVDDGQDRDWLTIAGSALIQSEMRKSLKKRLMARGDSEEVVEKKLQRSQWEIPEILGTWPIAVINDNLEEATAALCGVVEEAMGIAIEDRRFAAWSGAPLS